MKVLKFGGKTITSNDRIKSVIDIILKKGKSIIIAPAMPEITALLEDISDYLYKKNIEAANESINVLEKKLSTDIDALLSDETSKQKAKAQIETSIECIRSLSKDLFTLFEERIVLAQGEIISSHIIYLILKNRGANVSEISALDFMKVDKNAEPDTNHIKEQLNISLSNNNADIYVTQGYICRNAYGEIDDFRKGGNDFSATLIGAAIKAEEIQIWTDVEGMQTVDSSIVKDAKVIDNLSFDEAAEMAYFGDKVLHPTSLLPAKLSNIPVRILSIISPDSKGTLISDQAETGQIKAIATKDGITSITIKSGKMLLAHGFLRRVFEIFELHQTSIDMLASSEIGISLTIDNPTRLADIVDDLKKYGTVSVKSDMTIVCIIGDLSTDSKNSKQAVIEAIKNTPIRMISYGASDNNFSFLIETANKKETLQTLNNNLFKID